jgi:hypothetical protein
VNAARLVLEIVQQRPLGEAEVRALVLRRHATLVAPPDPRAAPFRLELRGELVGPARRRAAGERDLLRGAGGSREELGDAASSGLGAVPNLDFDFAAPQGAPAASSRERSIAA